MLVNGGAGRDPWTAGRAMTEAPEIDSTAVVRNSDFGRYTYLGPHSMPANAEIGDYGYAMGQNQIAHARIGKLAIVVGVPARPLRSRVDARMAEKLLRIGWRDWPHGWIDAALADFRGLSAEAFAEKCGG